MKQNKLFLPLLVLVLVVFIAVFGLGINYYNKNLKVDSDIVLDVNPSIVLSTNYKNEIIKVKALNDDGEEILKDINVNDLTVEEATNTVIDRLIKEGYLEGDGANLLLTIQNNDLTKAKEIESSLLISANNKLDEEYIAGTVITQVDTRKKNIADDLKDLMNDYNISYSKAVFLRNIIRKDSTLNIETLAGLKINEISRLLKNKNVDISDIVGHNNEDSLYESATLTRAKKELNEAKKTKAQAEAKEKDAKKDLQSKTNNDKDTDAAKKAYEEAEQTRLRAEQDVLEAQKAYEEVEAEANKGETTQNTETNQNSNGQIDSNASNNDQGSTKGTRSSNGNS